MDRTILGLVFTNHNLVLKRTVINVFLLSHAVSFMSVRTWEKLSYHDTYINSRNNDLKCSCNMNQPMSCECYSAAFIILSLKHFCNVTYGVRFQVGIIQSIADLLETNQYKQVFLMVYISRGSQLAHIYFFLSEIVLLNTPPS